MQSPHQFLDAWHDFFMLLGTAAGTLVGLLFFAATIGAGVFSSNRQAPLRVFLSTSVVHFTVVLTVSMIILAPITNATLLGVLVLVCGLTGLIYYGVALRDAGRDGLMGNMDLGDRVWYAVLPVLAYLAGTAAAILLIARRQSGSGVLAATAAMLLLVGIHNAWDIMAWTMTRRQE
jgi:hypothetical protein